jgi:N-acetyl-gamma-glutamylphosphate reductase
MPRINTRHADGFIARLEPFTSNGAISAAWDQGAYVVKSYSTAIAVIYPADQRAVVNAARYSVTTSRHQAEVRHGLSDLDLEIVEVSDPAAFTELTGHRARIRGAN